MISPTDYIKWVQRSLNRELDLSLDVSGSDSPDYRTAVSLFNSMFVNKPLDDKVDVKTQDALIRVNEQNESYVRWLQAALEKAGVTNKLSENGHMDNELKIAIKSFQAFQSSPQLDDDGWVGPKTELALIKASGTEPPGESLVKPHSPVKPPSPVKPLSKPEMRAFVFGLIGEPKRASVISSAYAIYKIAGAPPYSLNTFAKTLAKVYAATFSHDPDLPDLHGLRAASYAIMDAATGRTRSRIKSKARREGYTRMEGRLSFMAKTPGIAESHEKALMRLASVKSKKNALLIMYLAMLEVFRSQPGHSEIYYDDTVNRCNFQYPRMHYVDCVHKR